MDGAFDKQTVGILLQMKKKNNINFPIRKKKRIRNLTHISLRKHNKPNKFSLILFLRKGQKDLKTQNAIHLQRLVCGFISNHAPFLYKLTLKNQ